MAVSDYSTSEGSNTSISGINIAEGCSPGNINNAIRQLMADVKTLANGLDVGSDVQAYDAGLASIAGLTTAANKMIYTTALDTYAVTDLTAAGRALLDDADAAAQLLTLGAQASDATLTSLSGLSLSQGDILYATAADTLARLAKGTAGQVLAMNSGATAPEWGSPPGWTWLSAISTPSGSTPADFNIPSTATEIMILFLGTDRGTAGDDLFVRLGTAAAFENTGYEGRSAVSSVTSLNYSTQMGVLVSISGATYGTMSIRHVGGNKWVQDHSVSSSPNRVSSGGGFKTLSDVLTRIRVLPSSGNWAGGSVQAGYR